MSDAPEREYRFLDTEDDRRAFLNEVKQVRQEVVELVTSLPESVWYEPRYHGWSPAGVLGHLQLIDNLGFFWIQLGMVGVTFALPLPLMNSINDFTSGIYRTRLVSASQQGIERTGERIEKFVMQLPMKNFTKQVYYPAYETTVTVEQAVQDFFLFHWQLHLNTMRRVEDSLTQSAGGDAPAPDSV